MYDLNILVEEIVYSIKQALNEGLSKRLFHFCPVNAMYSIAKTDCFKLSPVDNRPSDAKMTSLPIDKENRKQYKYYMCFSRTPSSLVGYVSMRRDKTGGINWQQSLVRIEIDGEKLGSNYKGMPVNYFNDKNLNKINHYYTDNKGNRRERFYGKHGGIYSREMDVKALDSNGKIRTKTLQRYTPHADDRVNPQGKKRSQVSVDYGVIDRNQMSEYEDRLFSNSPSINNVKELNIIKRIDVFLSEYVLNGTSKYSNDILFMVDEIIDIFGDLVHVYNNFSSFENVNIVNSISGYNFKKQYLELEKNEYSSTHNRASLDKIELLPTEITTLTRYATILAFYGFYENWERNTFENTLTILNDIGVDTENNQVIYMLINNYLSQINKGGSLFFRRQSRDLEKELDKFPPYKFEKYVSKLENIRAMEENAYAERVGKRIGILSVKSNFC